MHPAVAAPWLSGTGHPSLLGCPGHIQAFHSRDAYAIPQPQYGGSGGICPHNPPLKRRWLYLVELRSRNSSSFSGCTPLLASTSGRIYSVLQTKPTIYMIVSLARAVRIALTVSRLRGECLCCLGHTRTIICGTGCRNRTYFSGV